MTRVDLKKRVRERFEALPKALRKAPVYLGVSAGLDSSVLASVALDLRGQLPLLCFLHVNYGLRKPDCDREEQMLRDWAAREEVPLDVLRLAPRRKRGNLQAWARERRFSFFRRVLLRRSAGKGTVWLAHHRRDQAETVLLRMLRGAGLKGLAGMSVLEEWEGLRLFRPFLQVPHEALRIYAKNHRVLFRRDRSNDTDLYFRNRIRRRILPLLRKENPRVEETLGLLAQRAGQASAALEASASRWLGKWALNEALPWAALRRQAPGLQAVILEQWLKRLNPHPQSLGEILPRLLEELRLDRTFGLRLKGGALEREGAKLKYLGP